MLRFAGLMCLASISLLACAAGAVGQEFRPYDGRIRRSASSNAPRAKSLSAMVPARDEPTLAGPTGLELQPASRAAADSPPAPEPPVKDGAGQTGTKPSGQALGNGSSLTLVRSGEAAFNDHCTTCHDAEKSLTLTKSLVEWQAVVRKMAKLDDADIPQNVHESIAVYLASRIAPQVAPQKDAGRTDKKPSDQAKGNAPDPALVRSGETAFSAHCTSCHNAEKSLTQTKGLAGWRANVRRMAEKDGASIPQAFYLGSTTTTTWPCAA